MIGNSSMPGEVSKALAIWRGMHSQHGRRNPRKSWRKSGDYGNKMLKTVPPQPSISLFAIKLHRIRSGSSKIGQQMMLLYNIVSLNRWTGQPVLCIRPGCCVNMQQ